MSLRTQKPSKTTSTGMKDAFFIVGVCIHNQTKEPFGTKTIATSQPLS